MKRYLICAIAAIFVLGCESKPAEQKFSGVVDSKDYISRGMEYLKTSDVEKAIQSFDMAIREDPENVDNYLILGQVYLRLGNVAGAVDTFSAATKVDPVNGEAQYLLATGLALQGKKDLAIEAAQKGVQIFMSQRDTDKFKRAVALLQGLSVEAPAPNANVQKK